MRQDPPSPEAPRPPGRKVYLAGPDVFLPDPLARAAALKASCRRHGLEGVFPLDALLDEPSAWAALPEWERIARRNEAHIRSCAALIANLTPFRGPSADVGTVFELGFMRALGRPVFGWSATAVPFEQRSRAALGMAPGSVGRDADGLAIESFGCSDNLMIDGAIRASGGILVLGEDQDPWPLGPFEDCVRACAIAPGGQRARLLRQNAQRVGDAERAGQGAAGKQPCDVPHLAAGPGLRLAVVVRDQSRRWQDGAATAPPPPGRPGSSSPRRCGAWRAAAAGRPPRAHASRTGWPGRRRCVQCPELCGRGASSLTSTPPSRSTNISTASRPDEAEPLRDAYGRCACAEAAVSSGIRAGRQGDVQDVMAVPVLHHVEGGQRRHPRRGPRRR